ncbi:lytic murein transglycosylase, partial [Salmonella enterica subsp. enterica serovar Braenderup]
TLSFDYPPRAEFFRKELREFLLLAREEQVDPLTLKGSYAGAMGLPQFMPSSFRAYAVDFDGDGHINISSNPDDAIGSVASY